ncbi:hypothetical protein BHE17_13145 [Planococcus maritimus]|nr:hypothetical protein AY633_05255 [Planococcus maritimus]OED33353.1 hypothetical protein BHE17_13145 [Planococcus maritimus]
MQLMRQDVALSAARSWGGCLANVSNFSVFEHRLIRVAPTSAQPSLCSGIARKHLLRKCVANEWTQLPLAIY